MRQDYQKSGISVVASIYLVVLLIKYLIPDKHLTLNIYSSEIKVNLANSPEPVADKLSEQTPSPYLVPALVVSLLLNVVTSGAIITNYIDPTDRSDSQPYQALHLHLVTPHTYCNVGHLLMFNLLIVQLVKENARSIGS